MSNEFKVKNGLIVIGDLTTSGTITINGALAATQSWVTSQAYLTSASLSGYATQSYVTSAISSLIDAAPAALDTLNELAAALGDDANFSTTITNSIAAKLPLAGGTMSGILTFSSAYNAYIYTFSRVGLANQGRIIYNNGTGSNMFFGELASNVYGFTPNAYTDTPALAFNFSTNNVGIGTSSPLFNLQVGSNAGTIATTTIRLQNSYLDTNGYYGFNIDAVDNGVSGHDLRFLGRSSPTGAFSELVRIKNTGNVGIGITSPTEKLHVNGDTRIVGNTYVGGIINAYQGDASIWVPNLGQAFTVKQTTGNVGIGTSSPNEKLDVRGNIYIPQNNYIYFDNSGHYIRRGASDVEIQGYNGIQLRTNSTTRVYIDQTGNVGIGTTTPSYKLDVAGSIRTQDGYIIGANGNADITIDGNIGSQLRYGNQKILFNSADAYIYTNNIARLSITNAGIATFSNNLITTNGIADPGYVRITNPEGGISVGNSPTSAAIKIALPANGSFTNIMLSFTVHIYDYALGKTRTLKIAGYTYYNQDWYNMSVYQSGGELIGNINVRFGVEGGRNCVWIGETNTYWSYPNIFITDVQCGHSQTANLTSGWTISLVTTLGTVQNTIVAYTNITTKDIGGTTNYVSKFTGANTLGNSLIFDNGTNVGIGTSSPAQKLDVVGTIRSQVTSPGAGNGDVYAFAIHEYNGNNGRLGLGLHDTGDAFLGLYSDGGVTTRIDSNGSSYFMGGNVGIGTASPSTALDVVGTITAYRYQAISSSASLVGYGVGTGLGMFNAGTDTLGFATASTERMRITSGGDIQTKGGTVYFGASNTGDIFVSPSTGYMYYEYPTSYGAIFRTQGGTQSLQLNASGAATFSSTIASGGNINVGSQLTFTPNEARIISGSSTIAINNNANNTNLLLINNSTGNVGIGTSSPAQKLDVNGNISLGSWIKSGSTYVGLRREDDGSFGGGGDSGLVIESYNHASPYAGNYSQRVHLRTHLYNGGSNNVLTAYGTNVGIGTTTPGYKLETIGNARISGNLSIGTTYNGFAANIEGTVYVIGASVWVTDGYGYANASSGGTGFFPYSDGTLVFNSVNSEKMRIAPSGNVGIGTNSPGYKLEVEGSIGVKRIGVAATSTLDMEGNFNFNANSGYSHVFKQAGSEVVRILPSGNVGIGTSSPANKLVVTSDASPTSENSYAIAAASASDPAYKTVIGYDYTNDIGLIAAVRTGIGWRNLSIPQGSLGIGTYSPSVKLHVVGNAWINRPTNKVDNASCTELPSRVEFNNSFASGQSGYMIFRYPTYNNFLISGDYDGNIGGAIPNIQFGKQSTVYLHMNSSDGNIGIGTTSPTNSLEVQGAANTSIQAIFQSSSSGNAAYNGGIQLGNAGSNQKSSIVHTSAGDNTLTFTSHYSSGSANKFIFAPGGTETVRFLQNGNVGIGTTDPTSQMSGTVGIGIYNALYPAVGFKNSTTAWLWYGQDSTFRMWNATFGDILTANTSGNIGIGTSSPGAKLHVVGKSIFENNMRIYPASESWAEGLSFIMPTTVNWGGLRWQRQRGNSDGNWYIGFTALDSTDDLVFGANNGGSQVDNIIRLTKAGNVGIGTSSPSTKLDVNGVITATGGNSTNWNTAYGWGNHASASYATTSYVTTQINNLVNGAPGALDTLNELATALGNDASFATTVTNSIATKLPLAGGTMSGALNLANNDIQGVGSIYISDPGAGEGINWNGGNGWGIFECPDVFDNTAGNLQFALNATTRLMTLNTAGALWIAGALTEASSLKLKENVETSEGNLEKVVNLRPVTYNKIGSQTKELGLIAEEVATVYPEFVQYDESGEPVGVNYSRLTAALIGAVKELTQRIETLENNG